MALIGPAHALASQSAVDSSAIHGTRQMETGSADKVLFQATFSVGGGTVRPCFITADATTEWDDDSQEITVGAAGSRARIINVPPYAKVTAKVIALDAGASVVVRGRTITT